MQKFAQNLHEIKQKLAQAAATSGRTAQSVQLIAVSKGHGESAVQAALAAGQRLFGENRVQEAQAKFAPLRAAYPDLKLHLIGPLQTNKAEDAVKLFDVIQTLDRPKLADALAKAINKTRRAPDFYIEINSGGEAQKAGIAPKDLPQFLAYCRESGGLNVTGLMCIPPQGETPDGYFRQLKQLADHHHLPHVSMGMSADFETAIKCGATEVRIGTALFGERNLVR